MISKVAPEVITTPVLVLVGPTAIGKTSLSLAMARQFNCEIVSVDSMQVYRYMDIGTAKPSLAERKGIPHHLLDIVDPDKPYDAARFVTDAVAAIRRIAAAGKIPLLTGGTGLYLKALTTGLFNAETSQEQSSIREELLVRLEQQGRDALFKELEKVDPVTAARLHPNDTQRLIRGLEIFISSGKPWSELIQQQKKLPSRFKELYQVGLTCDRTLLYERIEQRTTQMLDQGLIEEVEKLRNMGYDSTLQPMQAIGYRHVNNYLDGIWDRSETIRLLVRDTRRYAKRQMTWFSKLPSFIWYDRKARETVLSETETWLSSRTQPVSVRP